MLTQLKFSRFIPIGVRHQAFAYTMFLAFYFLTTIVVGQSTSSWIGEGGNGDGYFHINQNWLNGVTPDPIAIAMFDLPAFYEVWWNSDTAANVDNVGVLNVIKTNATFLNLEPTAQWELTINAGLSISGDNSTDTFLTVTGIKLHSLVGAEVLDLARLNIDGSHASGSTLEVEGSAGLRSTGTVNVVSGGVVDTTSTYLGWNLDVAAASVAGIDGNGNPSSWTNSSNLFVGYQGAATLEISAGGFMENVFGAIGVLANDTGVVHVTGLDINDNSSTWSNNGNLHVGDFGEGTLNIESGGLVSNVFGFVGYQPSSTGSVAVTGTGSLWDSTGNLDVGEFGSGSLKIEAGGVVRNAHGFIGYEVGSSGDVVVQGPNSTWTNAGNLVIGGNNDNSGGPGTLAVLDQGLLSVGGVLKIWSSSTVTLDGGSIAVQSFDNSHGGTFNFASGSLTIDDGLTIGSDPAGVFPSSLTLINSDHQLKTPATTTISPFRTLTIAGGALRTGNLNIQGTLAFNSGTLAITGAGGLTVGATGPFGSSISLGSGQNLEVTNTLTVDSGATLSLGDGGNVTSAVFISNSGRLKGTGTLSGPFSNNTTGEMEILAEEQMEVVAVGVSNFGEINNYGGLIRFDGSLNNYDTGFVSGRGQFIANVGWNNQGIMAFSAGIVDVLGDVNNYFGASITTSGGATTTFFDDVVHDGAEIRTAAGSNTVILGAASGSGPYTGTGTVFFEGDLRPGNSPGAVSMGGDVVFGSFLTSEFELGGTANGEFDQLLIAGDLSLAGNLMVSLMEFFTLSNGDEFLIAEVTGTLSGEFAGLNEGSLVGNFGGTDLSISYQAGDGNDVALIAAGLPGDFDRDGDRDGRDFLVWQRSGSPNPLSASDLAIWETNFGVVVSLAAEAFTVPEPKQSTTIVLALLPVLLRRVQPKGNVQCMTFIR